jgi:hypothetical protein
MHKDNSIKHRFNVAANWKKVAGSLVLAAATLGIAGCSDADIASNNLSSAADNFEINRRIVFYNGITGEYMLVIEGKCSLGNNDPEHRLSVTCKTGEDEYKKHFLGLSDNVTYVVEQIEGANVSAHHYRVVFKPQAILPDIDLRTDGGELVNPTRPEESPATVTPTESPAPVPTRAPASPAPSP